MRAWVKQVGAKFGFQTWEPPILLGQELTIQGS